MARHNRPAKKASHRPRLEAELHRAQVQLADVEALAEIGSWEWDILTDTVVWSDGLYALCGLSPDTFRPTYERALGLVHPEDRALLHQVVERARREGTPYACDHRLLLPDGSVRLGQSRGNVVVDDHGRPIKLFGTVQDITRKRLAEDARARYHAVIDSSRDAISTWSLDGKIVSWNAAAERLYGYRAEEVIGRFYSMLVPREHAGEVEAILGRLRRGERLDHYQTVRVRKDGSRVDVSVIDSPILDAAGEIVGFSSIARDLSAASQSEETLLRSRTQLRAFASQLRAAREQERTRIAREVHDELGQSLTALKLDLFSLSEAVAPEYRDTIAVKTRAMAALVDRLIDHVRTLATDLRPAVLDSLGLAAAVEWEVQQFARRTGIRCAVDLPRQEVKLDSERSTDVFRILQEALTNVARHAAATAVQVHLRLTSRELVLEVEDDGRGITEREIENLRSLGLLGMRERALLWGGDVRIHAGRVRGTSISIFLPLAGRTSKAAR